MADVFVVGSLNADHRVRVGSIPKAGETVLGSEIVVGAGGKGANQAVAASRAGAATTMIGACGDDADGVAVRAALDRQGVGTGHVRIADGAQTGRAFIAVDDRGGNAIVVSPGANARLTERGISVGLQHMAAGDILLLQLETPERLVRHAARTAARAGGVVIHNAAPVPNAIDGLFDDVDVLIVNEHELAGIARMLQQPGDHDMAALADASGAGVICTAGAEGSGREQSNRGRPSRRGGDTFIGFLAAGLARHATDLAGASEAAVRAASLAVTREGAIDSIPFNDEVVGAVRRFSTKGQA